MSAENFRFSRATQSQIDQCERFEWPHWGKGLSWETFKVRETILRDLVGQNIHFVLLDGGKSVKNEVNKSTSLPEATLPSWASVAKGRIEEPADVLDDQDGDSILAACQLFHRSATYRGKIYRGVVLGNVFVQPRHRGKGYARALKLHLAQWLEKSGTDFCCLYSEAGRLYEPEFAYMDTIKCHIPSDDGPLPTGVTLMETTGHGPLMVNSDITLLSHKDCVCLLSDQTSSDFVILPESHRYDFHFNRERCQAYEVKKEVLKFHGAFITSTCAELRTAYITWHASFEEDRLWILRLSDNGSREHRKQLLKAAQKIAHQTGLSEVAHATETLPEGLLEDFPRCTITDGHDSWPAMTYYHSALKGANWTNRQRYAWS